MLSLIGATREKDFDYRLFQLGADHILACRHVPAHFQDVGFAAYLAVFDILLSHSRGRIHAGFIPLATSRALKSRCHDWLL